MSKTPTNVVASPDIFALIVGLGSYRDPRIPNLKHTHDDARAFAELLMDPAGMAVPPQNVKLLLDAEATVINVKVAITGWLFENAKADSTVILFFAGHGHVEPDRSGRREVCEYLLFWDTQPDNLYATALSNEEFERCLYTVRARRLVVFMDACHSGGVARPGSRDVATMHDPRRWVSSGEGRVIITAAKASQQSWEDASVGHGIFTYHLLEALKGGADQDHDGRVSITQLYNYLERNVPESVRKLKQTVQEPFFYGELGRDIILTTNSRLAREVDSRDEEELRRQAAAIRARQQRLLDLYNEHQLEWPQFLRAMELLARVRYFSPEQQTLRQLLDRLLDGEISLKEYLDIEKLVPWHDKPQDESHLPPAPPRQAGGKVSDGGAIATFNHWYEKNRRSQPTARTLTEPAPAQPLAPPAHPPPAFCTSCGRRLSASAHFCGGCGRPLRR